MVLVMVGWSKNSKMIMVAIERLQIRFLFFWIFNHQKQREAEVTMKGIKRYVSRYK